jgi:hypothetical protein
LLPGTKGPLAAGDGVREARIVANHGARADLATNRLRLDDEGAQAFGGTADRGDSPAPRMARSKVGRWAACGRDLVAHHPQ